MRISHTPVRIAQLSQLATNPSQESFMDTFAWETLHILGFVLRGLILNTHHSVSVVMTVELHKQMCLLDLRPMVLLVLQTDKIVFNAFHPEPQVLATAFAAYQHNKKRLLRSLTP